MIACGFALVSALLLGAESEPTQRYLYVACPGIRNYLEFGGHGLLVFDIDHGHKFVKRIPTAGLDEKGAPINVKGLCASAATQRVTISTIRTLQSVDLLTEKVVWERSYDGGCDRMAISPDGRILYVPSFEKDHWHAVDGVSGDVLARIEPQPGAHNTVYGADGTKVYLAGLRSAVLKIADPKTHQLVGECGPFNLAIRPFTVNGKQTLCFVNVNELLGFEIGDLMTGKKLHHVEVQGFVKGPIKRHGCPSHGIGLTPDEREIWICDAANQRLHIFDVTSLPPKQVASLEVREQPGWITFSLDGKYAYPSTGDVFDIATRKLATQLTDEHGAGVHSEKMVEIQFQNGKPVRTGDQFGVGRVR
jgi:hypothetical protein